MRGWSSLAGMGRRTEVGVWAVVVGLLAVVAGWAIPLLFGEGFRDAAMVFYLLIPGVVASSLVKSGFAVDLGARVTGFRGRDPGTMISWAQAQGIAAIRGLWPD